MKLSRLLKPLLPAWLRRLVELSEDAREWKAYLDDQREELKETWRDAGWLSSVGLEVPATQVNRFIEVSGAALWKILRHR